MIQAVFFDLDRTLLDRDVSFEDFASAQFEDFKHRFPQVERRNYIDRLCALDAKGSVWKDIVYRQLVAELEIANVSWEELFEHFTATIADHYIPFPGLHETLSELFHIYPLGLITNGKAEFQQQTIARLRIGRFFKTICISESEGFRKPDPEIFLRTLRVVGCLPQHAVYVGDNPESDINAARRVGMKTVWKRNNHFPDPHADGAIDSLTELPSLIRHLSHIAEG